MVIQLLWRGVLVRENRHSVADDDFFTVEQCESVAGVQGEGEWPVRVRVLLETLCGVTGGGTESVVPVDGVTLQRAIIFCGVGVVVERDVPVELVGFVVGGEGVIGGDLYPHVLVCLCGGGEGVGVFVVG